MALLQRDDVVDDAAADAAGSRPCSAGSRPRRCARSPGSRGSRDDPLGQRLPGTRAPLRVDDVDSRRASARDAAISSGGSCRSQSITTIASPRADSSPASVASGWPKRREKRSILTRGSRRRSASHHLLGAVGRRIDAVDQLPLEILDGIERGGDPLIRPLDVLLLVVDGDHHAEQLNSRPLTAEAKDDQRTDAEREREAGGPQSLLERPQPPPHRRVPRASDVGRDPLLERRPAQVAVTGSGCGA